MFTKIKNASGGFWNAIRRHKFISFIIAVVVIGGGYYMYGRSNSTATETRYVLAAAAKGTLVSSISGTGQVSASNQFDVIPKVSGDVTSVKVTEGQQVKAGTILLQLDSTDAQKSVRDAQTNLDSAKLSLQKLIEPADALSLTQAQNALTQAQQSLVDSQANFTKSYDDGFNSISNTFVDMPGVITGLDSVLYGTTLTGNQANVYAYYNIANGYKPNADQFRDIALSSYQAARSAYDQNLQDYKNLSRTSDQSSIDAMIQETYNTTLLISDAIKNAKNLLDMANDALNSTSAKIPAVLTANENDLQSYTGTTNSHLSDLLNIQNTINNDKDAITNAQQSIDENTQSLAKLKAGPDPLDVQSAQLSVTQKDNALQDAEENLAYYSVRAPFDGTVAKLDVKKGDPASSGSAIATMITTQETANISLNEVDVAKVKVGQDATLTFDAFPDLTLTGQVTQVDSIGTVAQGVVDYGVEITLNATDDRVKPSMSVSAAIITDVRQDVITVPNSAIKTQNGNSYVQVLTNIPKGVSSTSSQGIASSVPPNQVQITTGISNGSMTEVASGLNEGDLVVIRTITGTATAAPATTQSSSLGGLRIPGLSGGGGGPTGR